ncbi:MAG: flagellar hook-basal body complex protein FliE [Burkholderiales bacterium]|jgi:flagellar hook-basal body complex protein FliE|nr:flagellar hook-basal body complex protein FliE [Burkholderiales bacterium]
MDAKGIDQLLGQMRALQAAAGGQAPEPVAGAGDFAALLKASLEQVSRNQEEASKLAQAFQQGAPNVSLEDVMISLQKADVSFQTMVQVRNKLVEAYQQIMNLQV